jgi:hypothetical protein
VLGPQEVKLRVLIRTWYDNATDFRSARTVFIPSSGTRTVHIAID